jgi:predicted lipid-binding transport protein (Tim44 family)
VKLGSESEYAKPKTGATAKPVASARQAGLVGAGQQKQPAQTPQGAQQGAQQRFVKRFDKWFEELVKAHQENNREKVDQLIKQMQDVRRKMQERGAALIGSGSEAVR